MRKYLLICAIVVIATGCQSSKSSIGKAEVQGSKILITSLKLEQPGFVLIRELTADNQPGTVVGLSPFVPQGETKDLLLAVPTMKPATTYRLSLRIDNGDRQFIAAEDSPALKGNNEIYKDIRNP